MATPTCNKVPNWRRVSRAGLTAVCPSRLYSGYYFYKSHEEWIIYTKNKSAFPQRIATNIAGDFFTSQVSFFLLYGLFVELRIPSLNSEGCMMTSFPLCRMLFWERAGYFQVFYAWGHITDFIPITRCNIEFLLSILHIFICFVWSISKILIVFLAFMIPVCFLIRLKRNNSHK